MEKLDGKTLDVEKANIEIMKELFPDIFTEGKIDMDKFMLTLGEHVEKDKERYELTWNGKIEAIKLAQKQTTGTLLPCKGDSSNWDTTENLYIEGDNLEVLRVLQNSYRNKVKMIYIDPPYNTGKDFVYKDDFSDNVKSYKERVKENMKSNSETNGRFHSDWLNMMYPRLKIAKNLLKSDGVIFISIDDKEYANLYKICNEIYGEENFIGNLIFKTATDNNATQINTEHEYILCYAKNRSEQPKWFAKSEAAEKIQEKYIQLKKKLGNNPSEIQIELRQWIRENKDNLPQVTHYDNVDEKGVFHDGDIANTKFGGYKYEILHPITKKACKVPEKGFRFPKDTMIRMINNNDIMFGEDETTLIKPKKRIESVKDILRSVIYEDGRASTKLLENLLCRGIFQNPKSPTIIEKLISFTTDHNDIVLDFFSGSGTTAHSVMNINRKEGSKRKFIMVQLPEVIDIDDKEQKIAFEFLTEIGKPTNISEIGKERIRRAGTQILSETGKSTNSDLDVGFRVFKLDETNLHVWDEESLDLEKDLLDMIDPVKEGRTQEDVVYEVLLKYGINLTAPIEKKEIAGKTVYDVGIGYLLICLERNLSLDIIEKIAKLNPARVVFYDEGFKDDTVRTNAQQILKRHKVEDIRVI
ncbi:site-specific DNA-methyltransferase [Virgibacillus alimentarius]|uniref:Adenine-specific DNA-methyltransferase n=1 Tax=Virgibacillus alimentarius TaxID=698769 RepID=A0ABS4S7L3_9BACI|nr:site-specific DNA-methyltransferase [Virgibacillus alimentarius]MBP2257489.1 adenine-specific DNA-methyltransferase [Virgibacillus alimentarius]